MFYVYVLCSLRTGKRYIGSCEERDERLRRHNAGETKSTRTGIPWVMFYSEAFQTRIEAIRRERYFKTGRGRDELARLE